MQLFFLFQVFVNGVQAGSHTGGYDAFSFDITNLLTEEKAEQELLVVVEDPTESQVYYLPHPRMVQSESCRRYPLENSGRAGSDPLGSYSTHQLLGSGRFSDLIVKDSPYYGP